MIKTYFHIVVSAIALLFCGCLNGNLGQSAQKDDLTINGIYNRQLLLDGTEGSSSTFSIRAKHDWKIVDYKGFSCVPSSGTATHEEENVTITATPLQSNNTGDTIRLSDLNFRLLSTRFVGISAYQLPQIIVEKRELRLEATDGATATFSFKTKLDIEDIEMTTGSDKLSLKISPANTSGKYMRYDVTVTSLNNNISSDRMLLGEIGFKVNGVKQERLSVKVFQDAALSFDRSIVLLPGHSGGENIFVINSKYNLVTKCSGDKFMVAAQEGNTYVVRALADNTTSEQLHLGDVEVSLADVPDSKISIEVHQRKAIASQTVMIYFVGTSLGSYYAENMNNMLNALNANIQGDARIVATFTNSTTDATIYELRYDKNLGKAVKEKVKSISLYQPYATNTFVDVIRAMKEFAPAENYSLLIGSHGHGWTPKHFTAPSSRLMSMGVSNPSLLWQRPEGALTRYIGDNGYTVQYDVCEVAEAITANGIKMEYILFDACFMGNIESAYELRNVTKYIVGSPCEVMGAGFPYSKVTPYMFTDGGKSYNLDKICSEYVDYYRTSSSVGVRSACIAITHTEELEALAATVKEVNKAAVKDGFTVDKVQFYDGIDFSHNPVHIFYDLEDLVEQSCADSDVVARFKTQMSKTVTSRYHTDSFYSAYDNCSHIINYYSGVTTSAHVSFCFTEWQATEWYKATH